MSFNPNPGDLVATSIRQDAEVDLRLWHQGRSPHIHLTLHQAGVHLANVSWVHGSSQDILGRWNCWSCIYIYMYMIYVLIMYVYIYMYIHTYRLGTQPVPQVGDTFTRLFISLKHQPLTLPYCLVKQMIPTLAMMLFAPIKPVQFYAS